MVPDAYRAWVSADRGSTTLLAVRSFQDGADILGWGVWGAEGCDALKPPQAGGLYSSAAGIGGRSEYLLEAFVDGVDDGVEVEGVENGGAAFGELTSGGAVIGGLPNDSADAAPRLGCSTLDRSLGCS